jgi:hypothetical protein
VGLRPENDDEGLRPSRQVPASSAENDLGYEIAELGAWNKHSIRTNRGTKNVWVIGSKEEVTKWKREPPKPHAAEYERYFSRYNFPSDDPFKAKIRAELYEEVRSTLIHDQQIHNSGKVTDIAAAKTTKTNPTNLTGNKKRLNGLRSKARSRLCDETWVRSLRSSVARLRDVASLNNSVGALRLPRPQEQQSERMGNGPASARVAILNALSLRSANLRNLIEDVKG